MNEKEVYLEMVSTIIDSVLDLKNTGMSDFMVKETLLTLLKAQIKEEEMKVKEEQGMLN